MKWLRHFLLSYSHLLVVKQCHNRVLFYSSCLKRQRSEPAMFFCKWISRVNKHIYDVHIVFLSVVNGKAGWRELVACFINYFLRQGVMAPSWDSHHLHLRKGFVSCHLYTRHREIQPQQSKILSHFLIFYQ